MARVVSFSMILAAVVATGCAHHSASAEDEVARISEYKLSLEDVVEVTVWKEPELSRTVPIRPDGKITLPLIGDLQAEGLRPADLEMLVAKQYATLVRDPRVTVIVHDVNGAKVYVTGQVMHSGAFPLRSTMNVLQALAMAGGLAEFANRGDITVLRTDGRRLEVDYDDLVKGKSKVSLGAMSEDWESVTKIGSKVRAGGSGVAKDKVIRGESALNAARRQGADIATEKKFGGTNSRAAAEGQHLTKVDRSDDIVKPKTVGTAVGDAIKKARSEAKNDKGNAMTQKDLATKINQTPTVVADFERGSAAPNEKVLIDMEKVLKVHLRGKNIGEAKTYGKKKQ